MPLEASEPTKAGQKCVHELNFLNNVLPPRRRDEQISDPAPLVLIHLRECLDERVQTRHNARDSGARKRNAQTRDDRVQERVVDVFAG